MLRKPTVYIRSESKLNSLRVKFRNQLRGHRGDVVVCNKRDGQLS